MTIVNFSTYDADCFGSPAPAFNNTGTSVYVGDLAAAGANGKSWLPFTVDIAKDTVITSATLKVRASGNSSGTTVKLKIGCEAADNPSAPTNWTQLNSRTLTTAYTLNNNVAAWTAGTEYTFDITTAVQEILNRAGWASGYTLAVMVNDNGSSVDTNRGFAASEHATYAAAILSIDYASSPMIVKSVSGIASASIKSVSGVAIASIKKISGVG